MNNIPKLLAFSKIDTNNVELSLIVNEDMIYFPGHFAIQAVSPGVALIDWAVYFSGEYFSIDINYLGMEVVKFNQVLKPNVEVTLSLEYKPDKNKIYYKYTSASGEHGSGRILLAAQEEELNDK
jgi:3-hydroxymyristoyl/3-hydroxydecanoyl-(acyl carrier protein) dehydratase